MTEFEGKYPGYLDIRIARVDVDNYGNRDLHAVGSDRTILDTFMQNVFFDRNEAYTDENGYERSRMVEKKTEVMHFVHGIKRDDFVQTVKDELQEARTGQHEAVIALREVQGPFEKAKEDLESLQEEHEKLEARWNEAWDKNYETRQRNEKLLEDLNKLREHFGSAAVKKALGGEQ